MKIREKYTFTLLDSDMESNNEPSMTIPDQSLTIPQILERYVSGIDLPYGSQTYYESDDYDSDNFETDPLLDPALDLADVTEAELKARWLFNNLKNGVANEDEQSEDEEQTTNKKVKKTTGKDDDAGEGDI